MQRCTSFLGYLALVLAPIVGVLIILLGSKTSRSSVLDPLQCRPPLPAEVNSTPSLHGDEMFDLPPDERISLSAPILLPKSLINARKMPLQYLHTQSWVQQIENNLKDSNLCLASCGIVVIYVLLLRIFYTVRKRVQDLLDTIRELNNQLIRDGENSKLLVSDKEIGQGSNGTIVLEGTFHGRPVAVKRILKEHHDVASKEIQNLRESDQHPNIVRWHGEHEDKYFVYVALELCICSLHELILPHTNSTVQLQLTSGVFKDFKSQEPNGHPSTTLLKLMRDTVAGLAHLHKLGIIHRDLKPQNVLIQKDTSISAKVSDMGISKRLPADVSSLINATGCGSSGWQSPEQLSEKPQTFAADLFSFGCVLFFCITSGQHPFGVMCERDSNILNDKKDLSLVANIPEAFDLIFCLLHPNPKSRPTATGVLNHPFFWNPDKRLSFLRDASDFVERKSTPELLQALENIVLGALPNKKRRFTPVYKWNQRLDKKFLNEMGRFRYYNYNSIRDLLRIIRNTSNHYMQLSEQIQTMLGPLPTGFESYFSNRFPRLMMEVYKVLQVDYGQEEFLHRYYSQGPF